MIFLNESSMRSREACSCAAPLLTVLSIAIVFSCLITVLNAVLQAYMKPVLPIIAMVIGAIVKIITEYILVGSDLGVMGAPISTIACTLTIFWVDLTFVTVYTSHRIAFKPIFKSLMAALISVSLSALLYQLMLLLNINYAVALISSIALAIVVYAFEVLLFGVVKNTDFSGIPFGGKILCILQKVKLIKE